MLIARFDGDVDQLSAAYDKAHDLIMQRGGAVPIGELRHHCAISADALYIIGVWESEQAVRARWSSTEFKEFLASVGFPSTPNEMTVLELRAIEPPLE
jgi:quinol monooxygenase YgiN